MANVAPGKTFTHSDTNSLKRVISSTFVNQTDEAIDTANCNFTFAEGENYLICDNKGLRRIGANVAFVGISFQDLSAFGLPTNAATALAGDLLKERTERQKELYGN